MRVLAIAYKKANKDEKEIDKKDIDGLYFVGLVGMIDPPREEAEEAIKKAHMAGIRVIMTTGDHKQTAIAIAKRIGITRKDKPEFPIAYSQEELKKLSKNEFSKVITNVNVFARLTPSMKLKITTLLQSKGNIVAMTGDGVNDAPALRKADIGIAMGITGTDVARESAEIVLRNDNFASIVSAVEEGRTIFTNIRQAVSFLVTTNLSEFLLIFLALFLGLPLPLLPTQVLWLNLVTDGVPDISLATEKGSDAVLKHRPRDKNENIISRKILPFLTINTLVMTVITFGVFTYFLDTSIDRARTAAFATMSFTQLFNVYNMRSLEKSLFEIGIFSNKYVNMAFLFSAVLSVIAIFNPFFKHVLKFNGLTYLEFICIVLVSLLVIVIGELYKYTKNKIYKPRTSVVYHSSEA
ncbi:hypothetical protein COV24_00645 [candidate division WWE3 bacterium CG10_big_fil_rev_8_21_14_0_10_32_10]|uniref:Cation-transporting P-type ATPase C-terminal domain-containing protein n=1 Tax=candidate division WWE3 bacterium CG10_big_fil_rev_8_21_14_0_10_32_10 TaxID=1975090 RepID=A0A2H0RCS7_UNCKA|nr:MAG: hypothetical protein COV24_00645 [candidate division WWE3 bacterium CG10_big_fil_rev_8_21_14_0_10_32_10]